MSVGRWQMACGLAINSKDEKLIVVAGGEEAEDSAYLATTEVLFWGRKQWERGILT